MKKFKFNRKTAIILIIISIFVVLSITGTSYALFMKTDKQESANSYTTANTSITITTVSGSISLGDMINSLPMSDTDGQSTTPYVFTVTNTGNVPQMVDISLISDSATVTIDGCSDNQLNQNYLKVSIDGGEPFALSQNSGVVINDLGLESSESKTYSLRYWLSSDTPNSEIGKHFHGLVTTSGYGVDELPVPPPEQGYTDASGANGPVLADGMIPIMWDGVKWVKADIYDSTSQYAGYDYTNKEWANAVMVTTATRETYMNADPGYAITESHVLAYYVWIPRYRYELFNVGTSTVSSQLINVTFETANTQKSTGSTVGSQLTHPAFTWGTGDELQELDGIWVGKFETTGTTSSPTVKPSLSPIVSQTVSSLYSANKV
ncbi:MAG: hypothetical protein Q4G04_06770, partial [bacterium]|nr:hypothetical protein [bacterium]